MGNQNGPGKADRRQGPVQLEHIEAIEKRLWNAADTLRSNSNYASNEYFMPVMGLIFLRHAYSRYLAVKGGIEAGLPKRGGKARALAKEDFSRKSAIFLRPAARFDHLVGLTDSDDRARAIIDAMESIEADYETLRGVLPKSEYLVEGIDALGKQLKRVRYFHKQSAWQTERFPEGELRDVEGLVKLVDRAELEANDYSLTPGRYVGVTPEEEDDGFDFEEALREIHVELEGLNTEAAELAARISRNFKELGI